MSTTVEAPEPLIRIDILQMRYVDAYTVASGIISLANIVKLAGIGLGILIAGVAVATNSTPSPSSSSFLLFGGCILQSGESESSHEEHGGSPWK